jgi:hypothetical protein
MTKVELMDIVRIEHYWPQIKEALQRVEPEHLRGITSSWLLGKALANEIQIWGVGDEERIDLLLLTSLNQELSGEKVLRVVLLFGQLLDEHLFEGLKGVHCLAKHEGCARIEVHGRRGWERKLRKFGYTLTSVVLECPVIHEGVH